MPEHSTGAHAGRLLRGRELRRNPEADDERNGQRSRTELPFLPPAEQEGAQRWTSSGALANDQRANTLRSVDFVSARADQIDPWMPERRELASEALSGIDVEIGAVPVQHVGNSINRLNDARLVVDVHEAHKEGISTDGLCDVLWRNRSGRAWWQQGDVVATPAKLRERFEDGRMLDRRRNDVPASGIACGQTEQREVVAFGGPAGEDDVSACAAGDGRDAITCPFDSGTGALAERVRAASGITEVLVHVSQHLRSDTGVEGGCRRTIEVDGHQEPIMHQVAPHSASSAVECLHQEWALFESAERSGQSATLLLWETRRPVVVLGHTGTLMEVFEAACAVDGVPILRRRTGGGSVVLGPGCLNFAFILSLVSHPVLRDVPASYRFILERIVQAIGAPDLTIDGCTDLVFQGRKVSGNAQRRGQKTLIHHGTLLYDFDAGLATTYLREPARRPAYRANRTHAQFLGNLPFAAHDLRRRLEPLTTMVTTEAGRAS